MTLAHLISLVPPPSRRFVAEVVGVERANRGRSVPSRLVSPSCSSSVAPVAARGNPRPGLALGGQRPAACPAGSQRHGPGRLARGRRSAQSGGASFAARSRRPSSLCRNALASWCRAASDRTSWKKRRDWTAKIRKSRSASARCIWPRARCRAPAKRPTGPRLRSETGRRLGTARPNQRSDRSTETGLGRLSTGARLPARRPASAAGRGRNLSPIERARAGTGQLALAGRQLSAGRRAATVALLGRTGAGGARPLRRRGGPLHAWPAIAADRRPKSSTAWPRPNCWPAAAFTPTSPPSRPWSSIPITSPPRHWSVGWKSPSRPPLRSKRQRRWSAPRPHGRQRGQRRKVRPRSARSAQSASVPARPSRLVGQSRRFVRESGRLVAAVGPNRLTRCQQRPTFSRLKTRAPVEIGAATASSIETGLHRSRSWNMSQLLDSPIPTFLDRRSTRTGRRHPDARAPAIHQQPRRAVAASPRIGPSHRRLQAAAPPAIHHLRRNARR